MMCILGLYTLDAQTRNEVIVGESEFLQQSSDDYSPITTGYDYSYSQQIYTAAELQSGSGNILSLAFKFDPEVNAHAVNEQYVNNLDVYLKNTDKQSFDSDADWVSVGDSDKYFSGEVYYANHNGGWLVMELDKPFEYTGGNLLVCVDNNTGEYKNNVHFYRYRSGSEKPRAMNVYRDKPNDITPSNVATDYSDYTKVPQETWFSDVYYVNPLVKFNIISGEILPILVNHEVLDLGYRPNNAWMAPAQLELSAMDAAVNVKSVSCDNDYFQVSAVATLPSQLVKGTPIAVNVKHGTGDGEVAADLKISYNDAELTVPMKAFAYNPKAGDVYELASVIEEFPFTATPNLDDIYNNYTLPGTRKDGKDVVYKLTLEKDAIVTASVEGTDSKIALYNSDFAGKGGPMADNSFVPENYNDVVVNSLRFTLAAGDYYLVASATDAFTLNVSAEDVPLPEQARISYPENGKTFVEAPLELAWSLATYTTEYQVLLGTTNPPTDVLVDWTDVLAEKYVLNELNAATKYFWQVNVRNSSGTVNGEVYSFSTPMSIPQNVVATPLKAYVGDTITLTWDAASYTTSLLGYNVYVDGSKNNDEVISGTTYALSDLTYDKDGHEVYVTSVYEKSETEGSDAVVVFVAGKAKVSGVVYESDGTTTVADATLTFAGVDEIGNEQNYTAKSDANGVFEVEVYAGQYTVVAKTADYESDKMDVVVTYGEENKLDVKLHEIYFPVQWINAVENEKSVDVTWSMNFLDTPLEDFETGNFDTRDWRNEGEYPWVATEDSYEGLYAIKSSCEKVNEGVSSIELEVNVPYDGFVTFYHRVSSEDHADKGNFYIDSVLQTSISGNRDWRYVEVFVTKGTHIYKWEYAKDESRHTYDDAYFVDNITLYKAVEVKEGWIGYDDGKWATSIGPGYNPGPTYWGVSFPVTVQYEGLTLTKIAVYDAERAGEANYTANIYLGGDTVPETLVSTKQFSMTGAEEMVEVELSAPVAIDGTQPLWITLYCDESVYPVATSLKSEHLTTDWLSTDGKDWKHAYEYNLNGTWMLRGYLEDASGKTRAIAGGERGFTEKYNVYRKNLYKDVVELVSEGTTATEYVDNAWETMKTGAYKWGVSAIYDDANMPGESEVVWSNTIDKDMQTKLIVTAKTNTGDPIAGTVINLVNTVESEYVYTAILGLDNTYVFDDFHKGVYEVTISKDGYSSEYEGKVIEIWNASEIKCNLTEDIFAVKNLYVSPTGWAMWDSPSIGVGDEFYYDFEDGTLDGWVTIDADNDNYTWQNSFEIMAPGSGHDGSIACVTSMSYFFGVLTPDNYLITADKYLIDETSKLRFWVCAQDVMAPAEHYGVAVSLAGNEKTEDFVTIWEETLSAKSGAVKGSRGTTAQGTWYEKVIDLSEYAGQKIYIALRHFDCTDEFYINVDDISLESTAENSRALESYNVYLDGKLVAKDVKTPYYQFEDLVDGQRYTTVVKAVYTKGESEPASYSWKKIACDKYEGVTGLKAEYVEGVSNITWTLPEVNAENASSRGGDWLTYDNGIHDESFGLTYDGESFEQFKWAVMFPAKDVASYAGKYLTKVAVYDADVFDGNLSIYEGGTSSPETLLHSQEFSCTGTNEYKEITLDVSVKVSGNENIWVVLSNVNGKQPASYCVDQGNPNGRWLYYEGFGWMDNKNVTVPAVTWQIRAYVTDDKDEIVDFAGTEVLGVMLYRNGKMLSRLVQGESFTDKESLAGDEYSVRVVYGGEKDKTYYAMSCAQATVSDLACPAPKKLYAYSTAYNDGRIGTMLKYPYTPPTSEWLHYDSGSMVESVGGMETFYYGIKFPVEKLEPYTGTNLTKVMFYDYLDSGARDNEVVIHIYYGGDNAPEVLVHTQSYTGTGVGEFVEVELTSPLPISGEESVWVILKTDEGMSWPAALSKDCGDANARWFSGDGTEWSDITKFQLSGTFMIRAFVTNEAKGLATSIEPETRDISFKKYNIYRGTTLDNMKLIASTPSKSYFDEVNKGTYYYQVTAVYEEDGEECESAPARAYENFEQNYVIVIVTAVNENGVEGLMVYPNPTNGNLNISVEAMKRITIANALGQIVYDQEVDGDSEIIDMAQYQTGIYMVRIVTDNGVAVKRISVVR